MKPKQNAAVFPRRPVHVARYASQVWNQSDPCFDNRFWGTASSLGGLKWRVRDAWTEEFVPPPRSPSTGQVLPTPEPSDCLHCSCKSDWTMRRPANAGPAGSSRGYCRGAVGLRGILCGLPTCVPSAGCPIWVQPWSLLRRSLLGSVSFALI